MDTATAVEIIESIGREQTRDYVIDLTPDKARRLLESNVPNRKIKQYLVEQYSGFIRRGEWKLTHQGLAIDYDGNLLDGQHRCWAVIETNKSIKTRLFLVPRENFDVIDTGSKRTQGDVLSIMGEKDANQLASILRLEFRYQQNHKMLNATNRTTAPSNQQLEQLLEQYPTTRNSLSWASKAKVNALFNPSCVIWCHYRFSQKDPTQADWFMNALCTGAELEESNPVWRLRNHMISKKSRNYRTTVREQLALIIVAWNAVRKGRKGSTSWSTSQDFPEIL